MNSVITTLGFSCLLVMIPVAPAATKEEQVAKYVKDLTSKDAATRRTAAEEIGKIGQVKASAAKEAVGPLLDALKDRNAGVREAAALAVGRVDEPAEAVPALVKLLNDEKEIGIKVAAARGLGQMGSAAKDAMPTLREVWSAARDAGKPQQRLAQATRDAMDQIQGGRKKN
jgi:HEAT repeat protein